MPSLQGGVGSNSVNSVHHLKMACVIGRREGESGLPVSGAAITKTFLKDSATVSSMTAGRAFKKLAILALKLSHGARANSGVEDQLTSSQQVLRST